MQYIWSRYLLLFLSFALITFVYSNSLHSSWHLDDASNITGNKKIHLTELTLEQITQALSASPSGSSNKLYRPIPVLTFALNWYFGQNDVYGYHVVNILIHLLTAYFLFRSIQYLFASVRCQYNELIVITTALFATLLWALAPIQTQAVTYIVQRMASMAAMFTVLGIYSYLRARTTDNKRQRYMFFCLCLLSYLAAIGSKINAILLPVSLLLIEIAFFNAMTKKKNIVRLVLFSFFILVAALVLAYYSLGRDPFDFAAGYTKRSFTLTERLLTEPRIVVMYLSQILLPIADRLSIEHDITLSTSLFSPWTTLPSIVLIFSLIFLSIFFLRKKPLFAFPVLFFFLNHLVESTIFPLELVFEHRNYLPSLFLFLPVGFLFAQVLYGKNSFSQFGRIAIMFCGAVYLIISGHATYTRNEYWVNEESLWKDALRKAPSSARAAHNIGLVYSNSGQYDKAYSYFQLAVDNADTAASPGYARKNALNGLSNAAIELGQYDKAGKSIDECIKKYNFDVCRLAKVALYSHQGLHQEALRASKQLAEKSSTYKYNKTVVIAAYLAKDLASSSGYIKKIIRTSLHDPRILYITAIYLIKEKAYRNSLLFLNKAGKIAPNIIEYQIAMAAAHYKNGQDNIAEGI
ncbi:MAG: tetratricopeptide repeat protein, partial [Candidatus Electrothrix sp. LOE1_4_5]|nr:tetratricopeptide repeat protein [Candidatus Electrothrix gigas]